MAKKPDTQELRDLLRGPSRRFIVFMPDNLREHLLKIADAEIKSLAAVVRELVIEGLQQRESR